MYYWFNKNLLISYNYFLNWCFDMLTDLHLLGYYSRLFLDLCSLRIIETKMLWLKKLKEKEKNTNRCSLTLYQMRKQCFNSSIGSNYEYSRTEEKYRKKYKKSRDLFYAKKKKKKFQTCYLRNELNKILDIYPQVSKTFLPFVCYKK